ncbi:DOPA 4,5-dioxygenase family protein [Parasedimentitalea psychrophila]|uniref:DOPA 4,5-dioxygenase family protein n=1 Tax=Parasedimentitalea psychrophila TaxID=2997337 RepID=A0A9Y2KUX0_9RHOB|nr:DOPA 4,5-dioxygenase family protein [Parasedimentitalea psychrophila]WIY23606.1 DOPA 4,5-dioxygenase family protein [Parasedimentitalea psychrophila]
MKQVSQIISYHAHVYFDADTVAQARALCQAAATSFGLEMGRVHQRNVGPHPMWSCQLLASPAQFSELLPWLAWWRRRLRPYRSRQ